MSLPKLPTDLRRDCLNLITRMVRTKDLDDLQGEASPPGRFDPHHQTKLKVSDHMLKKKKKKIVQDICFIKTIIEPIVLSFFPIPVTECNN